MSNPPDVQTDNINWDSVRSEIDETAFVAAMQASLRDEYAELADL